MLKSGRHQQPSDAYNSRLADQRSVQVITTLLLMSFVAVGIGSGCQNMIGRGQSPDSQVLSLYENKVPTTKYIGDLCGIYGLNFAKVEGIGLAVDLNGTGSDPKPSGQRDQLLQELKHKKKIKNPKQLLTSKDTELVVMKGYLAPGLRKGETFDLEVIPLGGTEATSLENGMIMQTSLKPMARLGGGVKQGLEVALARGRITIDSVFESRDDQSNRIHGVVLGGGKALEDRPLGLSIRTEDYTTKTTTHMARAINNRFTTVDNAVRVGVAEPKTDRLVELKVPGGYKHNVGRYLGVIRNIAFDEKIDDRVNRLDELEQELNDPGKSGLAAIRLEAIGKQGIPALKRALRHHDFEVQFHAAEALAYSGESDGIDILQKAAKEEPAFRWHALTALASIESSSAGSAILDLLNEESAETRYGAFKALREHSPQDPTVQGDWLAGDFFIHEVHSKASPMIHFSRKTRPEIVVFNPDQTVTEDFLHVETGLTIRSEGDKVSISSYSTDFGKQKKVCSNRIADLVRTLGTMGFGYGRQLKMFRSAMKSGTINTRLVVNAVPKLGRDYVAAENELPAEKSKKYVNRPLPELFRSGDEESDLLRVEEATVGAIDREIEERQPSRWGKLKGLFTGAEE
ncbi:MAG: flagellar basal body P-ring protein FlgI [Planctomycetota bacterium]